MFSIQQITDVAGCIGLIAIITVTGCSSSQVDPTYGPAYMVPATEIIAPAPQPVHSGTLPAL